MMTDLDKLGIKLALHANADKLNAADISLAKVILKSTVSKFIYWNESDVQNKKSKTVTESVLHNLVQNIDHRFITICPKWYYENNFYPHDWEIELYYQWYNPEYCTDRIYERIFTKKLFLDCEFSIEDGVGILKYRDTLTVPHQRMFQRFLSNGRVDADYMYNFLYDLFKHKDDFTKSLHYHCLMDVNNVKRYEFLSQVLIYISRNDQTYSIANDHCSLKEHREWVYTFVRLVCAPNIETREFMEFIDDLLGSGYPIDVISIFDGNIQKQTFLVKYLEVKITQHVMLPTKIFKWFIENGIDLSSPEIYQKYPCTLNYRFVKCQLLHLKTSYTKKHILNLVNTVNGNVNNPEMTLSSELKELCKKLADAIF